MSPPKRSTGKILKNIIVYYLLYCCLALGIGCWICCTMIAPVFLGMVLGLGLVMFALIKIFKRSTAKTRAAYRALPLRKKFCNIISGSFFVNLMLVASVLYYINVSFSRGSFGQNSFMSLMQESNQGDMVSLFTCIIQYVIWALPVVFYSMLLVGILLQSVRGFFWRTGRFILKYVTVYAVFQVIVFLISAAACVISLKCISLSVDGASAVFSDYFLLPLKGDYEELKEILTDRTMLFAKTGTLIGGLTGAASYHMLSDIAMAHIWEKKRTSFGGRLRELFGDNSARLLIIMSVCCALFNGILYGVMAGRDKRLFLTIVLAVFAFGWVLSWWIFLKETKVAPYIVTFVLMYFVETVIAVPTSIDIGLAVIDISWKITAVLALFRIIGFAFIASMIAHYANYIREYGYYESATEEQMESNHKIYGGNVFAVMSVIAAMYADIKNIK